MSTATMPMYRWADLPWKKFRKVVWKLQKRVYQAMLRGDVKLVRKLQKLLMKSRAAKFLAVRRVAQENSGKSPGLTPLQRIYFKQYAKSSWRSYLTNSRSRYTTLATIIDPTSKKDAQGAAVDNNVEPVLDEERRIVFDKNHRPEFRPRLGSGVKSLVWKDGIAADAEAYKWLRELIYADQSIPDIWRPAWLGALLIFFFGTVALGSVDAIAQRRYLKGQAIRRTREVGPKGYERDHQNDTGYGITVYAQGRTL